VKTGRALGLVAIGASAGFFISPIYSGWRAEATGNWRVPVVEIGIAGIIFSGIFYWLAGEDRVALTTAAPGPRGEKLFPTRTLWGIFLFMSVTLSMRDFAGSGMGSLGSLYLQNAHGFNPKTTGFILSGIYLASAVSNPVFGHLSDGGRVRWAMILIFLAVFTIAIFPHVPKSCMFAMLSAYGFFFMSTYPVTEAAVMESVPDAVRGRVFGVFLTFGGLFGNLAHWAVGALVKNLGANAASPASYYPIYNLLALMLLGSMIALPCLHAIRKRESLNPLAAAKLQPAALK